MFPRILPVTFLDVPQAPEYPLITGYSKREWTVEMNVPLLGRSEVAAAGQISLVSVLDKQPDGH